MTTGVRFPYLRDACRDFLIEALKLLSLSPRDAAAARGETDLGSPLYGWLDTHQQELAALPSAASASSAVAQAGLNIGQVSDREGKELTSEAYAPWHVVEIILAPLVVEYVGANRGRTSYNARLYDAIYARLEEAYSIGQPCRFVAPLENFESERPHIRLESGLWIEPLNERDIEQLASFFPEFFGPRARSLAFFTGRPQWGMVMLARDRRFRPFSDYHAKFRALSLALRLASAEPVGYRFAVHYPAQRAFQAWMLRGASRDLSSELRYGPRYILRRADEPRFKRIFRELSDNPVLSAYPIAFSRFADAYWRQSAADALIDLWIALESLLAPHDNTGEATYRLALRIAYFLGQTSEERVSIDKDIRDSYRLRSDVVHGRKHSPALLDALTEKTAGYLRRTLRAVVQTGAKLDVERIDRSVRAGKKPSETQ